MNITTVPQTGGSVNVYVGSEPLVVGSTNNGVTVQQKTVNNEPVSTVVFKSNNEPLESDLRTVEAMQQRAESGFKRDHAGERPDA